MVLLLGGGKYFARTIILQRDGKIQVGIPKLMSQAKWTERVKYSQKKPDAKARYLRCPRLTKRA